MKYGVNQTGVYVKEVTGENAKSAGLQEGDLIYDRRRKVTSSDMLVRTIQKHEVGDKVKLTVVRGDEMKDLEVTLQESVSSSSSDN